MASALQTLQILGVAGVASYALARAAVRSGLLAFYRYAIVATPQPSLPAMPRGYAVRPLCRQLSWPGTALTRRLQYRRTGSRRA